MAASDCLKVALEKVEAVRKLTKEEKQKLKELSETMDTMVDDLKGAKDPETRRKMLDTLKSTMTENAQDLKNYKLTFLNDVVKRETITMGLDQNARNADGTYNAKKAIKQLVDLMDGDDSVDSAQRTVSNRVKSILKNGILKEKIDDQVRSGAFDKEIYIEMYNRGTKNITSAVSETAEKAMGVFKRTNDFVHGLTVNAGAKIGFRDGYLLKQGNYDTAKLIDAGPTSFVKTMKESLDINETFSAAKVAQIEKDPKYLDELLMGIYKDMTESKATKAFGEDLSTKSYKSKLKSRVFMFKDGEAAWNIDQAFGKEGKLIERLETQLESNSTFIANTQKLGVNASMNMARIVDTLKANIDDTQAFDQGLRKLQAAYVNTVAPPHQPTTMLTKFTNTMRAMSAFSKLGSSVFTAGYDVIPSALNYSAKSGEPLIKSFGEAVYTFVNTIKNQNADEIAEIMGTVMHIDPLINMGLATSQSKNFLGQKGNKFLANFSTFTGIPLQTKYSRSTGALLHAKNFEKIVTGKNLNEYQIKNVVEKYGFSADELAKLNELDRVSIEGTKVIDPSSILEMKSLKPDEAQALYFKYSNYIDDVVHKNTPTPTARTKRQMGRGYNQDQTVRDVLGLVMQFKETAWKLMDSNIDAIKEIHTAGGKGRVARTSVELGVVSAITYLGIEEAKARLFGRKSPLERLDDEEFQKVAFDYINKAAFAPIMSDILESGYSGRPGAAAEYILGPNYAVAADAGKVLKDSINAMTDRDVDADVPMKSALKFMKRNIAPSNWFPIKSVEGLLIQEDLITGRKFKK